MAQRSLQLTARSPSHFVMRAGLVAGMLVCLILAAAWSSTLGAAGHTLFGYLSYLNVGFLTVVAVGWYAPILTEEKEAETLGLLRLAGFRMAAILVGKSVGAFLATALLLGLQLPFAVLASALGGITSHQVQAGYAILGGYAVLAYGVGLLSTVLATRTMGAARVTGWVLSALLVVPMLGRWLLGAVVAGGSVARDGAVHQTFERVMSAMDAISPVPGLELVRTTNWSGALVPESAYTLATAGLVLVVVACLLASVVSAESGVLPRLFGAASGDARRKRSRPDVRTRALVWKDRNFIAGGSWGLIGRSVLYGALLVLCLVVSMSPGAPMSLILQSWGSTTMIVMAIGITVEAGVQSARTFRLEQDDRTLFGLCLLPMRIGTWAYFKGVGSMWSCVPAVAGFAIGWALTVLGTQGYDGGGGGIGVFVVIGFGVLYGLGVMLLLVHCVMLLSLYLPRGAFPVTLGAFALIGLVMEAEMRLSRGGCFSMLGLTLLPFYCLPVCAFLQTRIGRRLRSLAAR